ncbi:MAG: SDR family oxidoreductase [Clostridiales Family XIII bacterium]|jgi:NAD(P)-dependent dehydrogenase (short-subunit alcohol dehydrogenase family)|nr:SDR family oxidoreductase [Clostridiales Family XIII bacterium]
MSQLAGKVAIITGAGSGMAKASSILFAREGASVVAADLNEEAVKETVATIVAAGGKAIAVKSDISDEESVKALVETTVTTYGKIDILFCIAGFPEAARPITEIPLSEGQKIFNINVLGTWLCCKYAYPELKKTGNGVILTIGSGAALRPRGGTALYSASKGAIVTMTRALANEFAPEVRVNCIMPGGTDTPMMKQFIPGFNDEIKAKVAASYPLQKFVQPEDIANMGLFLAADTGSKMTGAEYMVDSGLSIARGKE